MRIAFVGQVPKNLINPESNEDKFFLDLEKNKLAVSDGASESFDSKIWADILASNYVKDSSLNIEWVENQTVFYKSQFDINELSWSKQSAFNRGSFATLLGVEFDPIHTCLEVLAIGDSLVVLINNTQLIDAYPYRSSASFKLRPELLSTVKSHNAFLEEPDFYGKHTKTWNILGFSNPTILCMTDALGEWALNQYENKHNVWNELIGIRSIEQLDELVKVERKLKKMKVDDVTLMQITF